MNKTGRKIVLAIPIIIICMLMLIFFVSVIRVSNLKGKLKSQYGKQYNAVPIIDYLVQKKEKTSNGYKAIYTDNLPLLKYLNMQDYEGIVSINKPNVVEKDIITEDDEIIQDTPPQNEDKINEYDKIIEDSTDVERTAKNGEYIYTAEQLSSFAFLSKNIYTFDSSIIVKEKDIEIDKILNTNVRIEDLCNTDKPKVLIYHTHSMESYSDSRKGVEEDTIIGVGSELARILYEDYNISVYHHKGKYDVTNGIEDRSESYKRAEAPIKKILEQYPSIELVIDVHRDGVASNVHLVTTIDGKATAKIMFFNGICKTMQDGELKALESSLNPYVNENMGLSLNLHLKALELYPKLTRKIYIRGYRYNLHFMPNTMLVEVGAQTNTVEEAKNAAIPLARLLYEVCK